MSPAQLERRNKMIVSLCLRGKSMQKVGEKYGICRERVRQIIREHGIPTDVVGSEARRKRAIENARKRKQAAREHKRRRVENLWGVPLEEYERLRAMDPDFMHTPLGRFIVWRKNQNQHHGGCYMTFAEWWGVWERSGKYHLCGFGSSNYVMSRRDFGAPLTVDNAMVDTLSSTCSRAKL